MATLRGSVKHVVLASLGVVAALLVAVHLITPDGMVGELSYLGVLVGAGIVAVWGATSRPGESRVPWCWIAFGVCLSGLGDLAWSTYVHVRGFEPDVSVADAPWLASYLAISIGLLMLLRSARRDDRSDVDGMIDMAVVGVVSLLIVWQVAVQATIHDTSVAPVVRVVWASYPVLDAVLLALVIRMAIVRSSGALLLVAGVGSWLFSDFFYMLFPDSASWAAWLDAGWMVGAVMIAAATWRRTSKRETARRRETVGAGRIALAIAPLLVPGAIEVVSYSRGDNPDPVPMLVASFVLAALAFVRALRLVRSATRAQAELQAAEHYFRALVQRSSDAALVLETDGTVRSVSPAAREQFGYEVDDLVGSVGWDLVHPDDRQRVIEAFGILTTPGAHASLELRMKDAAGHWPWVEGVVTNLVEEPAVAGFVANIRDISARKAAEQELSRMAHYDNLTELPNRWLLIQQLEEALATDEASIALLVIDLDQFKFVNDSRGHAVGDQLLQVVAESLRASLPASDTMARIGGDEFAIICRQIRDEADARRRADAVHDALGGLVGVPGNGSFFITGSVGISIAHPSETPERLLQQADTAMYAAKRRGSAQSVIFDEQLRNQAEERLTTVAELRTALRTGELVVHYQPVIDLATGSVEGVEALVRWRHPTRGLLLPGDFIPIAEQSDLIDAIGEHVLGQACTDAAWWARAGISLSVAVNVSAIQLSHEHIADIIQTALYNSGLPAELLVVEITETALLLGAERVMDSVAAIRALGARVALDDFGTGYSSLSYLKRVPADIVKIDRSFITGIAIDPVDRDIAGAIIDLASALGRTVIAEGVETEQQHTALRRLGCPFAQGYLWSAAVPAEEIIDLARNVFVPSTVGQELAALRIVRQP